MKNETKNATIPSKRPDCNPLGSCRPKIRFCFVLKRIQPIGNLQITTTASELFDLRGGPNLASFFRVAMEPNKVQLEIFEGPLDLLLYLVKKEEVDIYEVNLTKIATQFIEYIEVMRELDLDIAGEFLVMASTLMYIKSRELLPKDQQAVVEDEDEGDDPRWELIRQLVEYKKFKDAAAQLQTRELEQENIYARIPGRVELEPETAVRPDVSVFDLINAVNAILKRFGERDKGRDVFADPWTVSEK